MFPNVMTILLISENDCAKYFIIGWKTDRTTRKKWQNCQKCVKHIRFIFGLLSLSCRRWQWQRWRRYCEFFEVTNTFLHVELNYYLEICVSFCGWFQTTAIFKDKRCASATRILVCVHWSYSAKYCARLVRVWIKRSRYLLFWSAMKGPWTVRFEHHCVTKIITPLNSIWIVHWIYVVVSCSVELFLFLL